MSKINGTMDKLKYQMIIQWSEEDDCFLVSLPDFPGQKWRTHGETYEEAVANGKEALESLIISYEADGETLPEPKIYKIAG
jgi:predicted RNase H-like HicB family nuclease